MLSRIYPAAFALLLLTSCGGALQGPPDFQQTFGAVDEPCAPSKVATAHCTAHVLLVNRGGEGIGHATMIVPLQDLSGTASSARTASTVQCGRSIPDTPTGGYVDLTCAFDLPAGKTVATFPSLQSVDFTAAANSSSSGGDISGIATLVLAGAAALLAFVALMAAIAGRRRRTIGPARSQAPPSTQAGVPEDRTW